MLEGGSSKSASERATNGERERENRSDGECTTEAKHLKAQNLYLWVQ